MTNKYLSKIFGISVIVTMQTFVFYTLPDYRGSIVRGSLRPIQTAMIVDDSSKYHPL